jgi:2-keto-4-pentenoate hydratase/2-oxohepta-3-ene-1,7-dioic acid hydratase in catechol pathway
MRLITYSRHGQERVGTWIDNDRQVVDLALASRLIDGEPLAAFSSMQALIDAGAEYWQRAKALTDSPPEKAVFSTKECTLLAPLPMPASIRDFLCFPSHLVGAARVVGERKVKAAADPDKMRSELTAAGAFDIPKGYYDFPLYYIGNRAAVFGSDVDITWPAYSSYIDYELEWAAVIGKKGAQISKENAGSHIFGYTIFNDWSARDEQMKVMGGVLNLGPGQGKDFANGFGPCIVTADEIPDPYNLSMKARINGVEVSNGSTSSMHYKFEDLIVYLTRGNSLLPGELLGSGTVGGGCSIETGRAVSAGDVIELEVQGIGVLRNRVVAPHLQSKQSAGSSDEMFSNMSKVVRK